MSRCKFIVLFLAWIGGALSAFAQALPQELQQQLATHLVQADFTYVSEADVTIQGEGKLCVQDSCYVLDLGVLQIYCDGHRRWTVDRDAKEVYIESVNGSLAGVVAGYHIDDVKGLSEGGLSVVARGGDGTRITLTVPRMKLTAKADADQFRFSTSSIEKDWTITDLTN